MTVFLTAVVEPAALVRPESVSVAEVVTVPSASDEMSTRIESLPSPPIVPAPVTTCVPSESRYWTDAPTAPLTTSGASIWSPYETNGAISTTGAAGAATTAAVAATGGSVSGELIGLLPEVRSTSRLPPGVLPACGSRG